MANEPIRAGDRMPPRLSMRASWVPAFTYTTVPANMPSWLTQKKVQVRIAVRPSSRLTRKKGNTGTRRSVNR